MRSTVPRSTYKPRSYISKAVAAPVAVQEQLEEDQVLNNTGGYVYSLKPIDQIRRFLILGSESGTFYVGERKLTKDNLNVISTFAKNRPLQLLQLIETVSKDNLAPKQTPSLAALAIVSAENKGNPKITEEIIRILPAVARTGTQFFEFVEYLTQFRGNGRGAQKIIGSWYLNKKTEDVIYQVIKYQNRNGWTHADTLLQSNLASDFIAKPKHHQVSKGFLTTKGRALIKDPSKEEALKWVLRGWDSVGSSPHPDQALARIWAFEKVKEATKVNQVINLITDYNLPRECIPTQFLNTPEVWEALLEKMPFTALLRNLNKLTALELLKPLSKNNKEVVEKLTNIEIIRKSKVHPLQILTSSRQYIQGHGDKGSLVWKPVPSVKDALETALELSFKTQEPTGKNFFLGLDVSGSMTSRMGNSCITCAEGTAVMALALAKTEKNYYIHGFSHKFIDLGITKKDTFTSACKKTYRSDFGSTDCSLPMTYAKNQKLDVDCFVVITDNETNYGGHPARALSAYRKALNPNAKQVVVGMVATNFTIADPKDKGTLDVVGFDSSAISIIQEFAKGNI